MVVTDCPANTPKALKVIFFRKRRVEEKGSGFASNLQGVDTEGGGKKWDEHGLDMKELLVLQRERARAWDQEKGPPGMPGSTCCFEQHHLDQGAQGFIQVRCKYPHKGRPQTSVRSGPGAEHPYGESHVLISSSLISLGLVLPLCTLSVPCSSPLLRPQHFCCPQSHQPGCKKAVGRPSQRPHQRLWQGGKHPMLSPNYEPWTRSLGNRQARFNVNASA